MQMRMGRLKLLQFIMSLCVVHAVLRGSVCGSDTQAQAQALLALRSGIVDTSGSLRADWLLNRENPTPCKWSGITCDQAEQKVIGLDLSQKNLTGSISDDIQLLKDLMHLNISQNLFAGPLPVALYNLSNLRSVDISHNFFNGTVPRGISNLKSLVNFNAFSNSFTGPLPLELARLPLLRQLNLAGSYFEGSIPPEYGSFRNLEFLHLAGNSITGPIPPELGRLQRLRHMEIGYNTYEGGIPWQLGNMTMLRYLDIAGANLSGGLPVHLSKLTNLSYMFLFRNTLTGFIPPELSNISSLASLDLSDNMLSGPIPESFTRLKDLRLLSLMYNNMSGNVPQGMGDLPNLETFLIWNNFFSGSLPRQLGSNSKLRWLDVSTNKFTGPIPPDLCAGGKLFKLILFANTFTGDIPPTLSGCQSLWRLRIAGNLLSGRIPAGLGMLPNLTFMDLSVNNLTGGIPSDLCNAATLQYMNVSYNPLGGRLPSEIWTAPNLQIFSAASANLSGKFPSFTTCHSLCKLELQGNALSGSIPNDIIRCQKLLKLELSHNEMSGLIPPEIANLPAINHIDLSHNTLSGTIPSDFNNCTTLRSFNVSFNDLFGPVPSEGIFRQISPSVFAGNPFLCGGVMSPCSNLTHFPPDYPLSNKRKRPGAFVWLTAAGFAVVVFLLIVGTHWFYKRGRRRNAEGAWKMTTFGRRLSFTVEDVLKSVKSSRTDIIGGGSSSIVYKAHMPAGDVVAVKKIQSAGVLFESKQVDVLGNAAHTNILSLLGCCSNDDSLLLLSEYMPNGNLSDHLHLNSAPKEWMIRYKIGIGVARGLCYLHHDCFPAVVHPNVKASNILLDAHMEPRLSDFGVSKLIQTVAQFPPSYGYIAPEYACTLQADEKGDIYSFGVVLLELLTGRRPVDSGINIVDWVRGKADRHRNKESINLTEVLDQNMRSVEEDQALLLLQVALLCTSKCPSDRPSMRDVVTMLSEANPGTKGVHFLHRRSDPSSSSRGATSVPELIS